MNSIAIGENTSAPVAASVALTTSEASLLATIADLKSRLREATKVWVIPSQIKPGHGSYYECSYCSEWSSHEQGNHHPYCMCGSDSFIWGDPHHYDPENAPTGHWEYPEDALEQGVARAEIATEREMKLQARIVELEGLTAEIAPRPHHWNGPEYQIMGIQRYGIRWNGPETPLAVPMDDGYWVPFHLAHGRVTQLESALADQGQPVAGAVFGGRGIGDGKVSLVERGDEDRHCAMTGAQRLYLAPGTTKAVVS